MHISGEKQLGLLSNLVYVAFRIQKPFTRIKEVNNKEMKPCIYAMWHGHQCCIHGIEDKKNLNVLISRSVDGEIIARVVEKWGFKTVRGSKGKQGSVEATMKLIERLKNNECIAMMVDGPSGPRYKAKNGVIKIAKMSGAPIVPVIWYSPDKSLLKLPSWDEFRYPLFYTRLMNFYGEPIYVNKDNTPDEDNEVKHQLQAALLDLEAKAPDEWKKVWKNKIL